ncbi:SRPBCC family protein [Methylobacterium sp. WSM2598]|uniref:SRPBCC family protein n=1 Tax=Methylobacterium sp. WSM2598 TaxID=398261 RepID=UPI0003A76683|nr:SRPBCC domain-containing protein [Methylobacterium sp. WSM2598]
MPVSATALPSGFEIDRAANTLRFVRDLAATPQRVFDAWTDPAQLTEWWDAGGERLSTCEVDLRVGGSFTFIAPSHPHMPFTGTYQEIAPPHLLVFDAMGATGRVQIDGRGDGSRLMVEIISPSAEHFEQFIKFNVHVGTAQTLDNLLQFLEG